MLRIDATCHPPTLRDPRHDCLERTMRRFRGLRSDRALPDLRMPGIDACESVRSDQMAGLRLVAEKAADPLLDCTIRLGYALVLAQMLEP